MSKNILVITEFIAPVQQIASIRWTKYAKYLVKDCDCSVTVLTNRKDFEGSSKDVKKYVYDSTLANDLQWFKVEHIPLTLSQRIINRVFLLGYRALHGIQNAQHDRSASSDDSSSADSKKGNSFFDHVMRYAYALNIPERVYASIDRICGAALVSAGVRSALNFDSFDVIISTYGPQWPHDLALRIKHDHPQLCWIADFRDPIVYSSRVDTRSRRSLAHRYISQADYVLSVNDGCLDSLFCGEQTPRLVISNGYDPEDALAVERSRSELFKLVYTGRLYADGDAKSDLAPLFSALDELIDEELVDARSIVFEYAGVSSHLFHEFADQYSSVQIVDRGLVSRAEAIEMQYHASALIVSVWNTELNRSGLSGKVFEYLSKDVPIIGLVSGNAPESPLRTVIEVCKAGYCYEEADASTHTGLKEYLLSLYGEWGREGVTSRGEHSMEYAAEYSYPVLAKRLMGVLDVVQDNSTDV